MTRASVDEDLIGADQVAAWLGITKGQLYQLRHKRQGPPAYRIGGSLRFKPGEVRAFINQRREP